MTVRKVLVVAPAWLMIGVFFLAPMVVLFLYSLGHSSVYTLTFGHTINNYKHVLETGDLRTLVWRSMWMGSLTGICCIVLAYPFVYAITLGPLRRYNHQALFLVLLSLFAAYIVRIYAWRTILGRDGIINQALTSIGLD